MIEEPLSPGASTCVLIGKAYRGVYKRARMLLVEHQVTPAQFILLTALWQSDGQSGAELGAALGLDSASMTGLIDRSEANGLIERKPDAQDRRINRVWLTSAGKALEDGVMTTMNTFDDQIAELVDGDIAVFKRHLARLGALR